MNKLYEFRHNWYKGIDFDDEANLLRKQLDSAKKDLLIKVKSQNKKIR